MPLKKPSPGRSAALVAAGISSVWLAAALFRGDLVWTPAFAVCLAFLWALDRGSPGGILARRPDAALFLGVLAVYLSNFRWRGGDDIPNSLIPFCLLRHGTLTLDPVLDPWLMGKTESFVLPYGGRSLSIFPVGTALLALPVYLIPALSGAPLTEPFLHSLSKLSASLITAASVLALRQALRGRCSEAWNWALCLLYAFGSWAFSVSSQALWQHGPAQLGVALGLWGLARRGRRWDVLAGFGFALAFAVRPDSVFLLAAAGAYVLFHDRRRVPGFAAGAAAVLALLASYWLYYTGRLRPPEYGWQAEHFAGFQPEAFAALLVSPTRGLLFFFPPAVLGVWAALRLREPLLLWMVPACLGPWVLLSFYVNWVGGFTFGPRYFSVAALVLTWACGGVEKEIRGSRLLSLWCALAAGAVLVHAAGAYLAWPWPQTFPDERETLWRWGLHPLAYMLSDRGGLHGLPLPARAGALLAVLAAAAWGAAAVRRRLAAPSR